MKPSDKKAEKQTSVTRSMIFFDIKCRLEGFLKVKNIAFLDRKYWLYYQNTETEWERKQKCVLLSDGTLRDFKVDGLFFHAILLFIFDLVKRDISDRFPTIAAEHEPGTEKSKI